MIDRQKAIDAGARALAHEGMGLSRYTAQIVVDAVLALEPSHEAMVHRVEAALITTKRKQNRAKRIVDLISED